MEWPISHLLEAAKWRAEGMPTNKRTIMSGDQLLVGALGELVAMDYFAARGIEVEDMNLVACDLRTEGGTWDVKTKLRTVDPRPEWPVTVPAYLSGVQLPDWYMFVSITGKGDQLDRAWLLGAIGRRRFEELAEHLPAGWVDPDNGYVVRAACRNLPISALQAPPDPGGRHRRQQR
jgi:hypothetical protein